VQPLIIQPATGQAIQPQATRVMPGHGTGAQHTVVNDAHYWTCTGVAKQVVAVLVNAIGGGLMILGMFFLPQVIGTLLHTLN